MARAARRSREAQLEEVGWQLHQAVHAGYRTARVARRRAELARELARFQHELVDVARRRVEAGEGSPLELRLAEAESAQSQQRAIAALQTYREACLTLAEVTGWDALRPPEPTGALTVVSPPALRHLVELAREHDPLLEVRQAAVHEAEARTELADREAWPNPSVGARYIFEGSPSGGTPQHVLMGMVNLPFPVAQRNQAGRARARAELSVAESRRDAHLAMVRARLERLRTSAGAALERVAAYGSEILPRFEDSIALFRRAFELGEIDILQLSVAVERLLSTQLEALDAYHAYYAAIAALEAEVGTELWRGGEE